MGTRYAGRRYYSWQLYIGAVISDLKLIIGMEILKFRAFSSKESEGFIILKRGVLPEIILEDILFQLFEPLFTDVFCPEVYFFSSTDEILRAEELYRTKDYIYVHFL